jgi:hypothetical protein
MAQLAHRLAPHDELVQRAFTAGVIGQCMPDFGYLTGFSRSQAQLLNAAYEEGRRQHLAAQMRSRS